MLCNARECNEKAGADCIAPEVREALDKAGKAEDRAAGYVALRFIVEGLKAGGYLK
jgi:hypothetical protein